MILSLAVIVIVGLVAYFHYLQGFFSAAISAVIALVAAIVAIAYHELVIDLVNGGGFSDYATSAILVSLFALTYIVLRAIFDKAVPGNVRLPLMADKIGAGVMGVFVGILACGVLSIAAQALRLSPTIAMYDMFALETRTVPVLLPGKYQPTDSEYQTLAEPEKFISGDAATLWLPADRLVLKLINAVSDEGAVLDAGKPFSSMHPDYLQELYGLRLSLQSGSKHTALDKSVQVGEIYTVDGRTGFLQNDDERRTNQSNGTGIRGPKASKPPAKLESTVKPQAGKMFLVLRTKTDTINADNKNNYVSFTPASVRLVANRKNYFPIGTLEEGQILFRNEVDDALFLQGGKAADLVFEVPEADVSPDAKDPAARKVTSDVFLEFKRFARVDLSNKRITLGVAPPTPLVEGGIARKDGTPANAVVAKVNATLTELSPKMSTVLFSPINPGTAAPEAKGEKEWGTFALGKNSHFVRLEVNPVRALSLMKQGQEIISDFYITNDSRMIMVDGRPAGKDAWKWADDLANYQLVDDKNNRYKPHGAMAKLKNSGGQDMMVIRYDADKTLPSVPVSKDMQPTDVSLLFVVPKSTQVKRLEYKKELLMMMSLKAD